MAKRYSCRRGDARASARFSDGRRELALRSGVGGIVVAVLTPDTIAVQVTATAVFQRGAKAISGKWQQQSARQ